MMKVPEDCSADTNTQNPNTKSSDFGTNGNKSPSNGSEVSSSSLKNHWQVSAKPFIPNNGAVMQGSQNVCGQEPPFSIYTPEQVGHTGTPMTSFFQAGNPLSPQDCYPFGEQSEYMFSSNCAEGHSHFSNLQNLCQWSNSVTPPNYMNQPSEFLEYVDLAQPYLPVYESPQSVNSQPTNSDAALLLQALAPPFWESPIPQAPRKKSITASTTYLSGDLKASIEKNHNRSNIRPKFGRMSLPALYHMKTIGVNTLRNMWASRVTVNIKHALPKDAEFFHPSDLWGRAVCIKDIHDSAKNIKHICNLLSNYGNIRIGMYFSEANCAVIVYDCTQGARNGVSYLNGLQLLGSCFKVTPWSHFDGLDPCYLFTYPEIYIPPVANRRFKKGVPKQANPVSATLHMCIFYPGRRRIVSTNDILQLLKDAGHPPLEIRRDNNTDNYNMWFVDFKKLSDALLVLMSCHDSQFEDGNIRISFTKSKRALQERADCRPQFYHQ